MKKNLTIATKKIFNNNFGRQDNQDDAIEIEIRRLCEGAGKTTYVLSASFRYGNGYLASYPDLT